MSEQAAIYEVEKPVTKLLPCPHCGSTDLIECEWHLDSGTVPAIECNQCYSGAVFGVWNQRVEVKANAD